MWQATDSGTLASLSNGKGTLRMGNGGPLMMGVELLAKEMNKLPAKYGEKLDPAFSHQPIRPFCVDAPLMRLCV